MTTLDVLKSSRRGRPVNFSTHVLNPAYAEGLPINASKMRDLYFLCNNNFIPSEHQAFFRSLPNFPGGGIEVQRPVEEAPELEAEEEEQHLWGLERKDIPDFDYEEWLQNETQSENQPPEENEANPEREKETEVFVEEVEEEFILNSEDDSSEDEE